MDDKTKELQLRVIEQEATIKREHTENIDLHDKSKQGLVVEFF